MEKQEFTLGPVKLIQDEEGYGIAHVVLKNKKEVWEVIANFKYLGDFMRFTSNHLLNLLQQEETSQVIDSRMSQIMSTPSEPKNESD